MDDEPIFEGEPELELTQASAEAVARLRAVVDISVMNMREHARIVGSYYGQLVGIGVPEPVAVALVVNFQTLYISSLLER